MEEKQVRKRRKPEPASRRPRDGAAASNEKTPARKKRRKKQSVPRVKNRRLWRNLLIVVAVSLAVVLTLVVFFRVTDANGNDAWYNAHVRGNSHYSAEKIWQASGIEDGDNLLLLSREQVAARIMARLPYVKTVKVEKKLPNQVYLTITEHEVAYAVKDEAEGWYLMTAAGKILESVSAKQAEEHLIIEGFSIRTATVGETAQVAAGTSATVLDATLQLLRALEEAGLSDKVVTVEAPTSYELAFWYLDQYRVLLGTSDELDYKLRYFQQVLLELESYTTGEIDLTFSSSKTAVFRSA